MHTYRTILQFLTVKTSEKMEALYGSEKTEIIITRLKSLIDQLYEKNADMLPDALSKRHAVNPFFLIALRETLQNEFPEFEDFEHFVMDIIFALYAPKLKTIDSNELDKKTRWKQFIQDKKKIINRIYDNPLFQMEITHEDRIRFGFDLHDCIYHKLLEKNNQLELLPILCHFEYAYSDKLQGWIRFSLQHSIAKGDTICSFRYLNIDP